MEKINLESTATTPQVVFDKEQGYFEITGKSLPENTFEFYKPLLEWMDEYVANPKSESTLVFKLEYFNTASTAHFLRLIKKLEKVYKDGQTVVVKWFHDEEDDDMREAGKDFQLLVKVPIEIIPTKMD